MFTSIRRRLTFANVASALALFIALGTSGAYATHEVILSSDIQDGEVKQADLGGGAVTRTKLGTEAVNTPKVADNNLLGADIRDDSLTGADILESQLGKVPDADTLDGVDSSELQRVGLVHFGAASETQPNSLPVIAWNELAAFRTDGDSDTDGSVNIANTGSSAMLVRDTVTGFNASVDPGSSSTFNVGTFKTFIVWSSTGTRGWVVTCWTASFQIWCHGAASRVG